MWNLALLLSTAGRRKRPSGCYGQLLEKNPDEDEARFRLGYLRLQRDDAKGAVEAFEACLKRRPEWAEAHANLALACAGGRAGTRADGSTRRCWSAIRSRSTALRGLAALALEASDFETALEHHVRLIDLGERSPRSSTTPG